MPVLSLPAAGRRGHSLFDDHSKDIVLSSRDVFQAFRDGPAIGCGFEISLSRCAAFLGIKDLLLGGLKQEKGLVFVPLAKAVEPAHWRKDRSALLR